MLEIREIIIFNLNKNPSKCNFLAVNGCIIRCVRLKLVSDSLCTSFFFFFFFFEAFEAFYSVCNEVTIWSVAGFCL